MTILSEIKTALSVVGMENFSIELKEYSDKAFGNYVVELTDGFNRLELVCDRGQVFMEIWDFKKNQFVACTDLFPEMEKVYTSNLNEVGLGEWTIEDVFRSYNEVTQSRT